MWNIFKLFSGHPAAPIPFIDEPASKHTRMTPAERLALMDALKRNTEGVPLYMDGRDTSWRDGITKDEYDREQDAQTIDAIKNVPSHY